jgi:hypothetical protein
MSSDMRSSEKRSLKDGGKNMQLTVMVVAIALIIID